MPISKLAAHELANMLQILMSLIEVDTCHKESEKCTCEKQKEQIRRINDYINVRTEPRK